jgi:hypothetical protein
MVPFFQDRIDDSPDRALHAVVQHKAQKPVLYQLSLMEHSPFRNQHDYPEQGNRLHERKNFPIVLPVSGIQRVNEQHAGKQKQQREGKKECLRIESMPSFKLRLEKEREKNRDSEQKRKGCNGYEYQFFFAHAHLPECVSLREKRAALAFFKD